MDSGLADLVKLGKSELVNYYLTVQGVTISGEALGKHYAGKKHDIEERLNAAGIRGINSRYSDRREIVREVAGS